MVIGFGIKKIKNVDICDLRCFELIFDFKINDKEKMKDGNLKEWILISIYVFNNNVVVGMIRGNEGSVVICDLEGNL